MGAVVVMTAAASCYLGASDSGSPTPTPGPTATGTTPSYPSGPTNLPCDVEHLLATRCWSCHGPSPAAGAPMSLVTRDELLAKSKSDPTKSNAELAVARMQSTTAPMPPGSPSPAADVKVLSDWIAAMEPAGTCADAGGSTTYDGPLTCTSGTMNDATTDLQDRTLMYPGQACIACHKAQHWVPESAFTLAGTVFPSLHEQDNCDSTIHDAQVIVTGADGAKITMSVNADGNFQSLDAVTFPITAQVVRGGKTISMTTPSASGDCNACHTARGTSGAPGRITAP